jgi:hypothetical protein
MMRIGAGAHHLPKPQLSLASHLRTQHRRPLQYVSEFMARLRQFAKSNLCHVFLVAHPKQRPNWRG